LIAGAVGRDSAGGSPEETAWAFRRLFETIASTRPLVLVVDDIQWAEPTMLDLLEYVVATSTTAPILIVCPARRSARGETNVGAAARGPGDAQGARRRRVAELVDRHCAA
jgi:hypothetical protein